MKFSKCKAEKLPLVVPLLIPQELQTTACVKLRTGELSRLLDAFQTMIQVLSLLIAFKVLVWLDSSRKLKSVQLDAALS